MVQDGHIIVFKLHTMYMVLYVVGILLRFLEILVLLGDKQGA